jgi:hypothetical protein
MARIPRPDKIETYECTICEQGSCILSFEACGMTPVHCPFDRTFGEIPWKLVEKEEGK